jgi:hypothetical protein
MKNLLSEEKKRNILDVFKFDISNYFESDYQVVSTEDSPAVQIVDYERILTELELGVFDTIHLMVMFDKFFITSDTHMNVTFRSKGKDIGANEIKRITNYFHTILGPDDGKMKKWTNKDLVKLNDYSFNRIWPTGMGDSFIKLAYKEERGFEVSILFLNNLMENIGKKIIFN